MEASSTQRDFFRYINTALSLSVFIIFSSVNKIGAVVKLYAVSENINTLVYFIVSNTTYISVPVSPKTAVMTSRRDSNSAGL